MNRRAFVAAALATGLRAQMPSGLKAGAAMVNITPALGCSLAGGMTDRIADEIHDELHVRACAIESGSTRVALATVDSCAVPRTVLDKAKALIESKAGIPASHVLLSATHTHSAPAATHLFQSQADPAYTDLLAVKIADAVRLAVKRLEPARVGFATGREQRLVFNRRYRMKPGTIPPNPFDGMDQVLMNPKAGSADILGPDGPTDPDVHVLAAEAMDGRPLFVYTSYALHYVGGGPGSHITADYFAMWAEAMERMAGKQFVPILANACSGNINGVNFMAPPRASKPYEMMREYADVLAAESFRVWRTMKFSPDVRLNAAMEELQLGTRLPTASEVAAARKAIAGVQSITERHHIYARETVYMSEYPAKVKTFVQAMRIGELGLATMPGEAFVELGMETKKRSPFQTTMMVELANDYRGYIPTQDAFAKGGYETWRAKSSYLEPGAAPKLVDAAVRLLARV